MEVFNEERNGDLVAIQPIYNAVVGFYAPGYESIEDRWRRSGYSK